MADTPITDDVAASVTEATPWAGFSDAWRRGFHRIFAIILVRGRIDPQTRLGRRHPATIARWLGLAYGPTTAALLFPLGAEPGRRAALLALLGTINAGMLGAAVLAWRNGLARAGAIDSLLRQSPDRDTIPAILNRATDPRWQATLPTLFALLPWVVPLAAGSPSLSSAASVALAANLTWTLFLLGNVTYWLIVPPWLVVRMWSWPTLALRWNDPARTPGLRALSEGYAYPALFLALAAGAVTVPGLLGVPLFGPYLPYIYGLLVLLSAWVGVATQAFIYAIVRRFRLRVLDQLADNERFSLTERRSAEIATRAELDLSNTLTVYGSIASATGLPYGTALVVQYVAAVAGSVTGLLLQ